MLEVATLQLNDVTVNSSLNRDCFVLVGALLSWAIFPLGADTKILRLISGGYKCSKLGAVRGHI